MRGCTPLRHASGITTWESLVHTLKVKVFVAQSCLTLCDPMGCSLPGSSVYGILQARILEWDSHSLLQEIFPIQKSNPGLLYCRQILYHLSHPRSQFTLCWVTNSIPAVSQVWGLCPAMNTDLMYTVSITTPGCKPGGFSFNSLTPPVPFN